MGTPLNSPTPIAVKAASPVSFFCSIDRRMLLVRLVVAFFVTILVVMNHPH
jgi:hypothetical protein